MAEDKHNLSNTQITQPILRNKFEYLGQEHVAQKRKGLVLHLLRAFMSNSLIYLSSFVAVANVQPFDKFGAHRPGNEGVVRTTEYQHTLAQEGVPACERHGILALD